MHPEWPVVQYAYLTVSPLVYIYITYVETAEEYVRIVAESLLISHLTPSSTPFQNTNLAALACVEMLSVL